MRETQRHVRHAHVGRLHVLVLLAVVLAVASYYWGFIRAQRATGGHARRPERLTDVRRPELNHPARAKESPLETAETKRRRIVLITAIFGPAKPHFPFFLKSAEKSGIDVIVFGDWVPTFPLPGNVFHVSMTWKQMLERIQAKVPECFANVGKKWMEPITEMRKIIDYKPLFGTILEDEIKDYWMWGYGDNDLVLGDVRKFLTDNVTSEYHVIPLHHDKSNHFVWGPATFFRNDPRVSNLFRQSSEVCKILKHRRAQGFDEWYAHDSMDFIVKRELKYGSLGLRVFEWPYPHAFWDGYNADVYPFKVGMVCELRCNETGPCRTIRQCNATERAKCTRVETVLCHFQITKPRLDELLLALPPADMQALLASEVIFVSEQAGFYRPSEEERRAAEARGLAVDGRESEFKWRWNPRYKRHAHQPSPSAPAVPAKRDRVHPVPAAQTIVKGLSSPG